MAPQSQRPPDHLPSIIYASSNTGTRPRYARIPSRKDRNADTCFTRRAGVTVVFGIYITVMPRNRPISWVV